MSLGLGSVIASAFETAPWLMIFGRHKTAMFVIVAIMLAGNYWLAIVRPRRSECAPGEVCHVDSLSTRLNRVLFWTSVAIWASAVIFTYAVLWWVRLQS